MFEYSAMAAIVILSLWVVYDSLKQIANREKEEDDDPFKYW